MDQRIYNVILSGGSGTRLWPLSRENKPKQFLQIFEKQSLFQHTVNRNRGVVDEFLLITNSLQSNYAKSQVEEMDEYISKTIIEPVGRNTAPAIALAALSLNSEDVMLVTPSDHMIEDFDLYNKSINRAIELAKQGSIVTFGIKPRNPNTGFGYIEHQGEKVLSFREKPDVETAKLFVEDGNFSWNSGIFCFKASVFLNELEKYNALMYKTSIEAHITMKENGEIDRDSMLKIPSDSIDYAVLEKSKKIKTISSSFYWTDLGTFDAIINYFKGGGVVSSLFENSEISSYFFSKKKVFTNIPNLVVIDTEDSIVVLEKGKTDDIKEIHNRIKNDSPNIL